MKKGFTLTELLVSIVIMTMLLMVVLPTMSNIIGKNNEELCKSYKDMTIEYAKVSSHKNDNTIQLNDIEGLETVKKECTGYVSVDKTTTPYTYIPHLTCSKCPNI